MGEGWTGKDLFQALSASVRKAGLPTMLHSRATRLVMDAAGRAIGVELVSLPSPSRPRHQFIYRSVSPWKPFQAGTVSRAIAAASQLERTDGVQKRIRARKGIVIATGGYAFNQDMLARYNTAYAPHATRFLRLGSLACTGSGIEMAHAAGAKLGKMDRVYAGRSLAPPQAMLDGIVVNSQGHRFINEDACNAFVGEAVANQPDGRAWLILDWQALRAVAHGLLPRDKNFIPYSLPKILNIILGGTRQSAQIRKLAAKCRIDSSSLEKTVTAYNAACLSGAADSLGKRADYLRPLQGRFFAIRLDLGGRYSFTQFFTLGGIAVNERTGEALDRDGNPIPRLYAAGRAAVGICSNSYACSGLSIADAVFSGRRAGRHSAAG
jgi:3-oxo-5alpha-steroid 4-dehydrogenase